METDNLLPTADHSLNPLSDIRLADLYTAHHLKAKADMGADVVFTQLFFDNNAFFDWRDRCTLAGIDLPIVAGIMPIVSMTTRASGPAESPRSRKPYNRR